MYNVIRVEVPAWQEISSVSQKQLHPDSTKHKLHFNT